MDAHGWPSEFQRDGESIDGALLIHVHRQWGLADAVTLDALKALPPLQSLAGDLPDDLSADEIAGCWTDAGLAVDGAADRAGFERAWFLLDDLYDDDLMVEARRPPKVAKA